MPRPNSKTDIRTNESGTKTWEDYEADCLHLPNGSRRKKPILLPVIIGMNSNGEFTQMRLKTGRVKKLAKKLKTDLPKYMFDRNMTPYDPEDIFDEYINYFKSQDGAQSALPPTPLDLKAKMPVWTLFYLKPKAWTFTKSVQFTSVNDPTDLSRNFEKIATLGDDKALLISNRRRCAPKDLKFNLHVTVTQQGRSQDVLTTPIIIDPEQDNDTGSGGFGGWA